MKWEELKTIRDDSAMLLSGLSDIIELDPGLSPDQKTTVKDSLGMLEGFFDTLVEAVNSDPDKVDRARVESVVNDCSQELYGEMYCLVSDLYDLFPLEDV